MADDDRTTRGEVVALRRALGRLEQRLGLAPLASILQGFRLVNPGDIVQADDHNLVMSQSVTVWANAASRSAGITAPVEGMMSYLTDGARYETYRAGAWKPLTHAGTLLNGSRNAAWSGDFASLPVGGFLQVIVFVSASNAQPNTMYDIGTLDPAHRPAGVDYYNVARTGSYAGYFDYVPASGLVRVKTSAAHVAGPIEVSGTLLLRL